MLVSITFLNRALSADESRLPCTVDCAGGTEMSSTKLLHGQKVVTVWLIVCYAVMNLTLLCSSTQGEHLDACSSQPCPTNQTCVTSGHSQRYHCYCNPGTTGSSCQIDCLQIRADIVFVMASSSSLQVPNWYLALDTVTSLIFSLDKRQRLTKWPSRIHFGLVVFNNEIDVSIPLGHYEKEDLIPAVEELPVPTSMPLDVSTAFRLLQSSVLGAGRQGDRPDAPNVVIYVTDGAGAATVPDPIPEVGLRVYAAAISEAANIRHLVAMTGNHTERVLRAGHFRSTSDAIDNLLVDICQSVASGESMPPPEGTGVNDFAASTGTAHITRSAGWTGPMRPGAHSVAQGTSPTHTPEGPPGYPGPPARPGEVGSQGQQVVLVVEEGTGLAGVVGPAGQPGVAGPAGQPGVAGPAGQPGVAGPAGQPGVAGPAGQPGVAGGTGMAGPAGQPGAMGMDGPTGPPGLNGTRGPRGERGPTGEQGDAGPAGDLDRSFSGCLLYNHICQHQCVSMRFGYRCQCDPGYSLQDDKVTCQEIDGCSINNGGCEHLCHTLEPSGHVCSCLQGFSLSADLRSCVDVDECCQHTFTPCLNWTHQKCVNTYGSYLCMNIAPGYQLNLETGSIERQLAGGGWDLVSREVVLVLLGWTTVLTLLLLLTLLMTWLSDDLLLRTLVETRRREKRLKTQLPPEFYLFPKIAASRARGASMEHLRGSRDRLGLEEDDGVFLTPSDTHQEYGCDRLAVPQSAASMNTLYGTRRGELAMCPSVEVLPPVTVL